MEAVEHTPIPSALHEMTADLIACPIASCGAMFKSLRALASHKYRRNDTGHGIEKTLFEYDPRPQRSCCLSCFSRRRTCLDRLFQASVTGFCKHQRSPIDTVRVEPPTLTSPDEHCSHFWLKRHRSTATHRLGAPSVPTSMSIPVKKS